MTAFPWQKWEGLAGWNFYFLFKLGLVWGGFLNFHALPNLLFASLLLYPIANNPLKKVRVVTAYPVGLGLLYHDTWLPGLSSIAAQGAFVTGFSFLYINELLQRFINWNLVAAAIIGWILFQFIKEWIRITFFIVCALVALAVQPLFNFPLTMAAPTQVSPQSSTSSSTSIQTKENSPQKVDNQTINQYVSDFYAQEKNRKTAFIQTLPEKSEPFDVLLINICSLAWDDMAMVQLMDHPLWKHFDILFKNFNSATGYSGPASIRLLRASCGQNSNADLFKPANPQCSLFENLKTLGFEREVVLNHTGLYGNYLDELRNFANVKEPLMSQKNLSVAYNGFDNSPIYADHELFERWLKQRTTSDIQREIAFFNLITLHDGNHLPGKTETAPYQARASKLFDELDEFLTNLEKSGKRYLVVVVPEHGVALRGDKLQMSGLRDIPMPYITHVPVGIRFINMKSNPTHTTHDIEQPSSFLAISELINRSITNDVFNTPAVDWNTMIKDLPLTAPVSENEGSKVVQYQGKTYIQLNDGDWIPE